MPVRDDLGTRMKIFDEQIPKTKLMRRTPVIIRIDGKAFHTFTRGFKRPFDEILINTMQATTKYLCENIKPDLIVNIGYAGSTDIKIGTWVNITNSYNYEWNIPGEEKYSFLDYGNQELELIKNTEIQKVECYSAEGFVTKTDLTGHLAFDMELHSVAVIGDMFKIPVMSLKKISDNLSLEDYYDNTENNENVFELSSSLELLDL